MPTRINKYISESGYCSRREADKHVEQGAVTIDGKKAEMGSLVSDGQVVRVFNEEISGKAESIIIAYNKPVGVVSTTDPAERDNVVNAIGHPERIFPIGRLDKDSQGLLLLTNEGDIVNKILRVNNNHDKEYLVTVDRPLTPDFIKGMEGGVPILGVVTRKCEITQVAPRSFTIVLRQGLNRQIRRMCEYFDYTVTKLQRTRVMHIHLKDLKVGHYRNLTASETEILYKKIASSVMTEEASTGRLQVHEQKRTSSSSTSNESRRGGAPKQSFDSRSAASAGRNATRGSRPSGRSSSSRSKGGSVRRTR